jgi:class 3 adenylate cyclase
MSGPAGEAVVDAPAARPPRRSRVRVLVWLLHVALPLLGLWLLVAVPGADVRWEDHDAHFALVLATALVSVLLALQVGRDASSRGDARLLLVAVSFALSAGFLGVHALATPGVAVDGKNAGFDLALPLGLTIAGVPALLSSLRLDGPRAAAVVRARWALWLVVTLLVVIGVALSLIDAGAWGRPLSPDDHDRALAVVGVVGGALYLLAAIRYYLLFRRRPAALLLAVITAFVLLAEALLAATLGRNWQLSWWEWHVLLIAGYGFVAYSAQVEYRREGRSSGLFAAIALEETIRNLRAEYSAALETLVDAIRTGADRGEQVEVGRAAAALTSRFGLTEGQGRVLGRAAESLAADRNQIRALDALVTLGHNTRIGTGERELLALAERLVRGAFPRDELRLGLLDDGALLCLGAGGDLEPWPAGDGASSDAADLTDPRLSTDDDGVTTAIYPLLVQGRATGVIELRREGELPDRERSVLASLASQLAIALENARLYSQLDGLFRSYLSPEVAASLLADPRRAALGGTIQEVTILMADLKGFTPFSERSTPAGVVEMLNAYWEVTVPSILGEGGTVVQFVGDAVMGLFGAPAAQPDHALRAGRAALAMQAAAARLAEDKPDWPRFRVGLNTGPAIVGNVGSEEFRNFSAIGDTTNVAARLEGAAPSGGVLIGALTREQLGAVATVRAVEPLELKGKEKPVPAFVLEAIAG